jgi:hypothetical protein
MAPDHPAARADASIPLADYSRVIARLADSWLNREGPSRGVERCHGSEWRGRRVLVIDDARDVSTAVVWLPVSLAHNTRSREAFVRT